MPLEKSGEETKEEEEEDEEQLALPTSPLMDKKRQQLNEAVQSMRASRAAVLRSATDLHQ